MDEKKEDKVNRNEELKTLLTELAQVQLQISALQSAIFEKQKEKKIEEKVDGEKEKVEGLAKKYRQNPEDAKDAIANYKGSLEKIGETYTNESENYWIACKCEGEKAEFKSLAEISLMKEKIGYLQEEANNPESNLEEVKEEIEKVKQQIEEKKVELSQAREGTKIATEEADKTGDNFCGKVDELTEDKQMVDASQKKPGLFQRFIIKLDDIINGKLKFNQIGVKSVNDKADNVSKSEAEVKEEIKEEKKQKKSSYPLYLALMSYAALGVHNGVTTYLSMSNNAKLTMIAGIFEFAYLSTTAALNLKYFIQKSSNKNEKENQEER